MIIDWRYRFRKTGVSLLSSLLIASVCIPGITTSAQEERPTALSSIKRQMEYLDRGLVAVKVEGGVFVSWRMLGTEPESITFNLYRDGVKVNEAPIATSTNYVDPGGTTNSSYRIQAVLNGEELVMSEPVNVWGDQYLDIPLQKPDGGVTPDGVTYTYSANDASAGDLTGDGKYEMVLKWDPSNSKDNAHDGHTGNVYIDAYKLDGTLLWRIDLGRNIRAGAHYTQFMVYDLDGDGIAEIAMKTADGTVDGTGKVIGDAGADYRNSQGRVLDGPEFLTIFDGKTGKELVTVDYDPPRGNVCDWRDCYGNRVDRFLAGIAYLDGERPSLIMARGYYTRTVLAAYNYRDGKLSKVWTFDSDQGYPDYAGQGNHSLSVADVDGDGKDEVIYGAMAIDHDGTGLHTTGWGHGDALHVGDLDPDRPGLEVFQVHEWRGAEYHATLRDAHTGAPIWGVFTGRDTGRGMASDIDPRYSGTEVWASAGVGLYSVKGEKIGSVTPSINFGIWWDGDLLREVLDHNWNGTAGVGIGKIDKWDYENEQLVNLLTAEGTYSNNWTKGTPALSADILGDWREEAIWRTADSSALRIYTTTDLTEHRFHTLMHDPIYRLSIAWQNVAYNQPPHTGFYLGTGMEAPPTPNIYEVIPAKSAVAPETVSLKNKAGSNAFSVYIGLPANIDLSLVNVSTVQLNVNGQPVPAQATPTEIGDYNGDGMNELMVKFDLKRVMSAIDGKTGELKVQVSGYLEDGRLFSGSSTLRVIP
ncbi:rhamnogalacturonan lyase [Paenibacillus tarimensis]